MYTAYDSRQNGTDRGKLIEGAAAAPSQNDGWLENVNGFCANLLELHKMKPIEGAAAAPFIRLQGKG